jgi:hypothetical protein
MKCAAEVGSGAMIPVYTSSLIKIGLGIHKLKSEIQSYRQHGDRISLL